MVRIKEAHASTPVGALVRSKPTEYVELMAEALEGAMAALGVLDDNLAEGKKKHTATHKRNMLNFIPTYFPQLTVADVTLAFELAVARVFQIPVNLDKVWMLDTNLLNRVLSGYVNYAAKRLERENKVLALQESKKTVQNRKGKECHKNNAALIRRMLQTFARHLEGKLNSSDVYNPSEIFEALNYVVPADCRISHGRALMELSKAKEELLRSNKFRKNPEKVGGFAKTEAYRKLYIRLLENLKGYGFVEGSFKDYLGSAEGKTGFCFCPSHDGTDGYWEYARWFNAKNNIFNGMD